MIYIQKMDGNIYSWDNDFDIKNRFILIDEENRPTKYNNDLYAHILSHIYNVKAYPQMGAQALRFDFELEYWYDVET